jgi:hypothetical protein
VRPLLLFFLIYSLSIWGQPLDKIFQNAVKPDQAAYGDIHEEFVARLNNLLVFDSTGLLNHTEQANLRFKIFDFEEYHQLGSALFIVNKLKPGMFDELKKFFNMTEDSSAFCLVAYSAEDSQITVHYTRDLSVKPGMFEVLNDQLLDDFSPNDHGKKLIFVIDELGFMLMGHRDNAINWRLLLSFGVLFLLLSFFIKLFLPADKKSNESFTLTLLRFMVLISDKVLLLLAFLGVQARALGVLFFLPFVLVGLLLENTVDIFSPKESLLASGLVVLMFYLITIPFKAVKKNKESKSWIIQFLVNYPGNYYESFMSSYRADPMRFLGSINISSSSNSSSSSSSFSGQGGSFGGGGASGRW